QKSIPDCRRALQSRLPAWGERLQACRCGLRPADSWEEHALLSQQELPWKRSAERLLRLQRRWHRKELCRCARRARLAPVRWLGGPQAWFLCFVLGLKRPDGIGDWHGAVACLRGARPARLGGGRSPRGFLRARLLVSVSRV